MNSIESCLLCFDIIPEEKRSYYSPKLSELIKKYLHSSFIQEITRNPTHEISSSLCSKCFESAAELIDLNEQMESFQKRISELVLMLSLEVLFRRGRTSGSTDEIRTKNVCSEKKLVEFDVSALPNSHAFTSTSSLFESDVFPVIAGQNIVYEEEFIDPVRTETHNCDNNFSMQFEKIKNENSSKQNFTDTSKNTEELFTDGDTDCSVGRKNSGKDISRPPIHDLLFPTIKLQRIQLQNKRQKVVVEENAAVNSQSLNEDQTEEVEAPIIWIKSEVESCHLVTEETSFLENCSENLESSKLSITSQLDPISTCNIASDQLFLNNENIVERLNEFDEPHCSSNVPIKQQFRCNTCYKIFKYKQDWISHSKIHTKEKSLQCDQCDYVTHWIQCLKRHKILIHEKNINPELPFSCDVCEKRFRVSKELSNHKRIHTGERPFQCKFCNKKFTDRKNALSHRLVHTGEKPFKCDQCNYATNRRTNLKRHKIHLHSSNSFMCRECGKEFKWAESVKTHYRSAHIALPFSEECVLKNA